MPAAFARNLHHAGRRLRRAPVFTITSVLTLTIGIGACALMMSVVSTIWGASYNLGDATNPERLDGVQATGEFFQTLGVGPEIGRFFERANETPASDHVVILSSN